MSETKFPEKWSEQEIIENLNHFTWYEKPEVDEWFKRCLNDKPSALRVESMKDWGPLMTQWVDRWFLQFLEFHRKGEEND